MKEYLKTRLFPFLASLILLVTVGCSGIADEQLAPGAAAALCERIDSVRYKSNLLLYDAARRLDTLYSATAEQRIVAGNALAYAALMRMDYSTAKRMYLSVIKEARCEVERLVADVGLMTVCYRTSANKDFFDYRSSALRRIRRINEEEGVLSADDKRRFAAAKIELAAVSLCYFTNLSMNDEAELAANYLEAHIDESNTLSQRLYGRMTLNYRTGLPSMQRVDNLLGILRRSQRDNELWITANCKLMLAVLLRGNETRDNAVAAFKPRLIELVKDTLCVEQLPYDLAMQATEEFERYGDTYMQTEALAVAASCATQTGNYDKAIMLLGEALEYINSYYGHHYPNSRLASLVLNDVYEEGELDIFECDTIENIYECMLSVRREASCAYAGLGNKYSSDVNRNAYLDLLRSTRLNRQAESRMLSAQESATRLYIWLVASLLLLFLVVVVVVSLSIKWKKRNYEYAIDLNKLLKVCRMLMSSLPKELSDSNAVLSAVCDIMNRELSNFSGRTEFAILPEGDKDINDGCSLPLVQMDGTVQWVLRVEAQVPLTNVKRSLLEVVLPYIAVAIDEGMRIVDIGDERMRLKQKQESYGIYLASHKRENVVKRVSLSVVNGMTPYMNRIINELVHLSSVAVPGEPESKRLNYMAELIAMLDEYNAVLEEWIKMKRGELSLHIESFSLCELFAILRNSTQGFLMKGIDFCVKDTDAVVKADKTLTLFMINTLADNAGKFTQRGGKVTVEAIEGDGYVEIVVSDTGCGMSREDISRILNNKVYDASGIGCGAPLSANKGSGFGIMNCKGIIEKYRKSDAVFSVCTFGISSEEGRGSRFSFRLPKGVLRAVTILFLMFMPFAAMASDLFFDRVDAFADSVYTCNVDGRYSEALSYAQDAMALLNEYYRSAVPSGTDTLSFASGSAAELQWWRSSLFPDSLVEDIYYNLLDIRNETAVAALAMQQWQLYRYNNSIYAQLYRMVHEDKELVEHYEQMRSIANYRQAAVAVCATLLVVLVLIILIMYMRRVFFEKTNIDMLFRVNSRLLNVARGRLSGNNSLSQNMADGIYAGIHEYLRVQRVAVLLKENDRVQISASPETIDHSTTIFLKGISDSCETYTSDDGRMRVLPLMVKVSQEYRCIGVMYLELNRALTSSESDVLELISSYAASTAYYSLVCLAENYSSLDDVEEETERLKFEENNLHVHNQVIDNCLSMIKHETIYYPGRIRKLVDSLLMNNVEAPEWSNRIEAIKELMTHYGQIFGLLSRCASRQLDDTSFSVSRISLDAMCERLQAYVKRKTARRGPKINLYCSMGGAAVYADEALVEFLFESLVNAMLAQETDGTLYVTAREERDMVRVEILDSRGHLSPDELQTLFVPVAIRAKRLEFLIAKEIVRMHEDYMDIRGGRVEAYDSADGTVYMFTLPRTR
ncbi:MAG: DUF5113 domain-containing protein [Bacteroidaceae bacterium]|nr:DUF5113 domain-containing protein [Bacteroidaceae bacterium]